MSDTEEELSRWNIIDGIEYEFGNAEVFFRHPNLTVRLIDERINVDQNRDLIIHFTNVLAYTVHEEFIHPTQGTVWGREPTISEQHRNACQS